MARTAEELKGDERIDSRDIIEAQEELRETIELVREDGEDYDCSADELELLAFDGDAEVGGDWRYGEQLILEYCFVEYARELADDIGAIPADATWPLTCIDWDHAARELSYDYTLVTFLGHDYYVHS